MGIHFAGIGYASGHGDNRSLLGLFLGRIGNDNAALQSSLLALGVSQPPCRLKV